MIPVSLLGQRAVVVRRDPVLLPAQSPPFAITPNTTYDSGAYVIVASTALTGARTVTITGTPVTGGGASPEVLSVGPGTTVVRGRVAWATIGGISSGASDAGSIVISAVRDDGAPATVSVTVHTALPCRVWRDGRANMRMEDEGTEFQSHLKLATNSPVVEGDLVQLDGVEYGVIGVLPIHGRRGVHHYESVMQRRRTL